MTTATGVWGPYYSTPIPGSSAVNIWQDVTWTTTTPAGTSTLSFVNGPLAGVNADEVGTGGFTITGSDSEIWYRDATATTSIRTGRVQSCRRLAIPATGNQDRGLVPHPGEHVPASALSGDAFD